MMEKHPEPLGLYLHIPFCHARCGYCDFVTFTGKEDKIDEYVADLCQEIALSSSPPAHDHRQNDCHSANRDDGGGPINTIFFGGGTPSVLEARHLQRIFEAIRHQFRLDPDAEITLEANPESITREI